MCQRSTEGASLRLDAIAREVLRLTSIDRLAIGSAHALNNAFTSVLGEVSLLLDDYREDAAVVEACAAIRLEVERCAQLTRAILLHRSQSSRSDDEVDLVQAILGYSEFAQEGLTPDDKRYHDPEQIRIAAEGAATLTSQLLAFGRRQLLRPIDIDLNRVIEDLTKMLMRVLDEGIELEFAAGEDLRSVHADPGQIERILMNLCINARDAMPRGGKISIETRNVFLDEARCMRHPPARPGHYVRLLVADGGCGMDEETLNQAFEPFFSTKESGKGTGLGLATVYGIVQQHEGI